jgi:hypothetical protein
MCKQNSSNFFLKEFFLHPETMHVMVDSLLDDSTKKLLHDAKDLPIDCKADHRVLKLMRAAHEMIGEFAYQPNNTS